MKSWVFALAMAAMFISPAYVPPVVAALVAWEAKRRGEEEWWWYVMLLGAFLGVFAMVVSFVEVHPDRLGLPHLPVNPYTAYYAWWWALALISFSSAMHFSHLLTEPARETAAQRKSAMHFSHLLTGQRKTEEKAEAPRERQEIRVRRCSGEVVV